MCNTCTTMKTGHAVIRLLCEFTITKWLDTGFNHAMSGIWHSNDCNLAASPASVVETYESFVTSMSGAISLIIFTREREKKNDVHCLHLQRWHDSNVIWDFSYMSYYPMVSIWVITSMNSRNEQWIVFMMMLINYSNEQKLTQ